MYHSSGSMGVATTRYSIMERRGGGGGEREREVGRGGGRGRGGGICPQTFAWLRVNSREGIILR